MRAMVASLPDDLIARIAARARDAETRTDAPPSTRGRTVTVGNLSVVGLDLNSLLRGQPAAPAGPGALAPVVGAAAIADAERRLGFALPAPLRQLYERVGNGGFGPDGGLLPLQDAVSTFLNLIETPPGQRGQKWPPDLLPFTRDDPGHCCIDIARGSVIFWDEEELADGASDKVWKRSFKPEAPDLAAWFERWLGMPSPEEKMKAMMEQGKQTALKTTLAYWRAKTPQERAAFGLPETGWEQKLFGHLGVDLSKL